MVILDSFYCILKVMVEYNRSHLMEKWTDKYIMLFFYPSFNDFRLIPFILGIGDEKI